MEKSDSRAIYIGGATLALSGFFYTAGFSLFTAVFCICAGAAGGFVASLVFSDASLEANTIGFFFENVLRDRLKRAPKKPSFVEHMNGVGKLPWDGLELPEPVNVAVEELIEQLLENYINSWYQTEISNDHAFLNEIRYQIRYASAVLFRRLNDVDLSDAILNEIVPIAVVHAERVIRVEQGLDKQTLPPLMVETKILESFPDIHCILSSRQAECDYLRSLADFLVGQLIDESRVAGRSLDEESPLHNIVLPLLRNKKWPSQSCRHFLRELLVYSFFIPVLDLLADPDTINNLLVLLFDPEPMAEYPLTKSKRVSFLYGLTKSAIDDTPESLIQLKLSEIVRDHRHLQMFSMYLKDSKGPTNVLKFLLQADDVHSRMQQKGLGTSVDENVKNELRADISNMFENFAKTSSTEYVQLPEELLEEFHSALESGELACLDRVIEKTYQLLYQKLQFDHVVTFCQSECYLGHLCGSPPEAVEELIQPNIPDKSAAGRRQAYSVTGQLSFSFSQFRSRLWSVIIPQSSEGSIDENGSDISLGYYSSSSRGIEVGDEAACVVGSLAPNIATVRYPTSSSLETFNVPAIDITMADDAADEAFIEPTANGTDSSKPQSGELICEKTRDMSRWRVQIPRIEPRRDTSGRTMFVYIISVERSDVDGEIIPRKWEVLRRYNEFYILESKLNEFHGDLIKTENLPRKTNAENKNREFIESLRLQFERYLQLLTQQSVLKRSDLLAVFLSGEEEISNNAVFSMSNTWKVVKKVPGKFSREKGQHVKPFLLHMMAVVLAPAEVQKASDFGNKTEVKSESSSISSISFEQSVHSPKQILLNSIYGNNCPTSCADNTLFDYTPWTESISQALLFLIERCFEVSTIVSCLLHTVLGFFRSLIDKVIVNLLSSVLGYSLNDSNVVQLVYLLQKALFAAEEGSSTEQEKVLRAELAQRRTVEYLQDQLPSAFVQGIGKRNFRHSIQDLFSTLQHPRLNKQLTYVLLDLIVRKLFPEFRS